MRRRVSTQPVSRWYRGIKPAAKWRKMKAARQEMTREELCVLSTAARWPHINRIGSGPPPLTPPATSPV